MTSDGTVTFNRSIRRRQLLKLFQNFPNWLVDIEACGSAHQWARELTSIGHDMRLVAAVYVKPQVKREKTDAECDPRPSPRVWSCDRERAGGRDALRQGVPDR
ncbi:transposase [Roseobacter sp. SK209-2-6]|nr:transposase [Roseobacter sp. SK209-2-6]